MINSQNKSNVIFLSVLGVYAILTSFFAAQLGGDFDIYLDAAHKLGSNENIYINN